ncbi:MAG: TolC family protein [Gammaproteobacteria bacterium]|nr:TolC family protein [Gammaproteobacteria bacterium]
MRFVAVLGASVLIAGCARYQPQPLPDVPDLVVDAGHVRIAVERLPRPDLLGRGFDPDNGLDMIEVAQLAVVNNPDLVAMRRRSEVARAQVFAARLLPDPQLSLSGEGPTDSDPTLVSAYGLGLSYDLQALVTRGASIDVARAAARQVDLDLLWQEWQVIQRARMLFVQCAAAARRLALEERAHQLFAARYDSSVRALREGNLTLDVTGTDLTALTDSDSRVARLVRQRNQLRHDLNALLGVEPGIAIEFEPGALRDPVVPDGALVARALADVAGRRPDLLALQAGYTSQEAAVRRAVLAQFPSLSVGITRARDTGDVHTTGFGITLNLPVFTANRGEIAVQRATREQLRGEFQARIDQTVSDVDRLHTEAELIAAQRTRLGEHLPELERMVEQARRAYAAGQFAALTYLNMETSLLNRQIELIDLEQSMWETRIALDTVLASTFSDGAGTP